MTKLKRDSNCKELQKIYYKNILMLINNKRKSDQGIFLHIVVFKNESLITAPFKETILTNAK